MNRRLTTIGLMTLIFGIMTVIARGILVGGATIISLPSAPLLSGVISQNLGTTSSSSGLPEPGKDYTLKNTVFFENQTWAISSIVLTGTQANTAVVILHKIDGEYQVIAGPGTAFPNDYLQSLPLDVAGYLSSRGMTYAPGA